MRRSRSFLTISSNEVGAGFATTAPSGFPQFGLPRFLFTQSLQLEIIVKFASVGINPSASALHPGSSQSLRADSLYGARAFGGSVTMVTCSVPNARQNDSLEVRHAGWQSGESPLPRVACNN